MAWIGCVLLSVAHAQEKDPYIAGQLKEGSYIAQLRMAHLYVDTQEYFLASQVLKRILDDPTDVEHQAEARLLLGQVYESLDFSDRALETYLPLVVEDR